LKIKFLGPDGELPIDAPSELKPDPVQPIDKDDIPEDSPLYEPPSDNENDDDKGGDNNDEHGVENPNHLDN
jgi:hypothetical protein